MLIDHLRGDEAARFYLGGLPEMPFASELTRAAATAQELSADLATHNVKHYPMFKSLRPPY